MEKGNKIHIKKCFGLTTLQYKHCYYKVEIWKGINKYRLNKLLFIFFLEPINTHLCQ